MDMIEQFPTREIREDKPLKLPSLSEKESSRMPVYLMDPIIEKGRELITPEGINASLDGEYPRPFCRDLYTTEQGLLCTAEDFGQDFCNPEVLIGAARSYLPYMDEKGELPHEVGSKAQKFPFEVDEITGMGKHFASVDGTGLAMLTLDKILTVYPHRRELWEEMTLPLIKMARWTIENIEKHEGMIGYETAGANSGLAHLGSREQTWQDGSHSLVDNQGNLPPHPMHPVLEQALYWSALNRVADKIAPVEPELSREAKNAAAYLRSQFNLGFVVDTIGQPTIARAIDGKGERLLSENIDVINALGFTYQGKTILNLAKEPYMPAIVRNQIDALYTPYGGLRTQGFQSLSTPGNEYHGKRSLWPWAIASASRSLSQVLAPLLAHDQPDMADELHGYGLSIAQADAGMLLAFGNPIETAHLSDTNRLSLYTEVRPDSTTFTSSRIQAWTVGWGYWVRHFLTANRIEAVSVPVNAVTN